MLIGLERHLGLAVRRPDPRPADPNPPTTQCHLPVLVTVTNSNPVRIVPPLRADDLLDLRLEQLAQDPEPDLDRQRQQPLSRYPISCPSASCTRSGRTASSPVACATDTVLLTAVPPSILVDRPSRSHPERTSRRDRRHLKVLRAPGQPRCGNGPLARHRLASPSSHRGDYVWSPLRSPEGRRREHECDSPTDEGRARPTRRPRARAAPPGPCLPWVKSGRTGSPTDLAPLRLLRQCRCRHRRDCIGACSSPNFS
jgi:hypothetical protein